jgi:ankyrin repeat protein
VEDAPVAVVKLLLENGADPNLRNDSGEGVMHALAQRSEIGIEELAVILVPLVGVDQRSDGDTQPIHTASERCEVKALQVLLKHGADVNAVNEVGFLPAPCIFIYFLCIYLFIYYYFFFRREKRRSS